MAKQLAETDRLIDGKIAMVKSFKNETGYPDNLTQDQVVRLIYFFGSRKSSSKAIKSGGSKIADFTSTELMFLKECFKWFGYAVKEAGDNAQTKIAYRGIIIKFKKLLAFLRARPGFITKPIHDALQSGGYDSVMKNIVMVVDEHRNVVPRVITDTEKKNVVPIGKMDTMLWEFQNIAMDKLMMIVEAITPNDIKKANLGGKSKALRDIYSVVHMARQANKNPNMTLISLNVGQSDAKEKMSTFSAYVQKNREQ